MAADPVVPDPAAAGRAGPEPAGAPRPESLRDAAAGVRAEQKRFDKGLGWTVHALGVVPLLGGPAVTAFIATSVDTGHGWFGVFVSTLAFASGVAAFVAVLKTNAFGELAGWPLVAAAGLCLVVGFLLSGWLAVGTYSVAPVPVLSTGTPLDVPAMFVAAAVDTWGVAGALLSGAAGAFAGLWGVRLAAAV